MTRRRIDDAVATGAFYLGLAVIVFALAGLAATAALWIILEVAGP